MEQPDGDAFLRCYFDSREEIAVTPDYRCVGDLLFSTEQSDVQAKQHVCPLLLKDRSALPAHADKCESAFPDLESWYLPECVEEPSLVCITCSLFRFRVSALVRQTVIVVSPKQVQWFGSLRCYDSSDLVAERFIVHPPAELLLSEYIHVTAVYENRKTRHLPPTFIREREPGEPRLSLHGITPWACLAALEAGGRQGVSLVLYSAPVAGVSTR